MATLTAQTSRLLGLCFAATIATLAIGGGPATAATGVVSVLSPTVGETVGEQLIFTASAPAGVSIAYVVSEPSGARTTAGTAAAAPYSVNWEASNTGDYSVVAYACLSGETMPNCTGGASPSVGFTVARMSPTLHGVTGTFSPNGDQVADTAALDYSLDVDSAAILVVTHAGDVAAVRPIAKNLDAGEHTYRWDGRDENGRRLSDGHYRVAIVSARDLADSREFGFSNERSTTVDLLGPRLTATHSSGQLFVARDGYKDTVHISTRSSRPASFVFAVRNHRGRTVRTMHRRTSSAGLARVAWSGRTNSGRLAEPGAYSVKVTATDRWGVSHTGTAAFTVDGRHLVAHWASRRLSPTGTQVQTLEDSCNFVFNNFDENHRGSLALDSAAGCSDVYTPDVAATMNAWTLPAAVKYGTVRLSVNGVGLNGSRALFEFTDPDFYDGHGGVLTTRGRGMSSTKGVSDRVLGGRRVHWVLAAEDGDQYVAEYFTISWTYWRLSRA